VPRLNRFFNESAMTTEIQVTKVKEHAKGPPLFNVRAYTIARRIEFPTEIQELGSPFLDEAAVLCSRLDLAEQLADSLRLRLAPQAHAP